MRSILLSAIVISVVAASAQASEIPPLPVKQFETRERREAVEAYIAQMAAYQRANAAYNVAARKYWQKISSVRSKRRRKRARGGRITLSDYVLKQPPEFTGPPKPERPSFLPPLKRKVRGTRRRGRPLPMVPDFLRYAKQRFGFVPELPANEMEYKRAYSRTALEAGITEDQAVRIYGFEASGNGTYDVQAGLESIKAIAAGRKPISTALGYNQLLVANTIGLVSKYGPGILEKLKERLKSAEGKKRKTLQRKIAGFNRMVRYARSIPYRWSRHVRASRSSKGRALHALILDIDIGPLLQTQKLVNSIKFARRLGYKRNLTAAELEMHNLTGDGNGFDMISLSQSMRKKVPTANFFQQNGYARNPVARNNNTVEALLAAVDRKMDYQASLDGAKQMARAFDEIIPQLQSKQESATQ